MLRASAPAWRSTPTTSRYGRSSRGFTEAAPRLDEAQRRGARAQFTGDDPSVSGPTLPPRQGPRTLVESGVETVLATLGARGAVLVTATSAWYAEPLPVAVVSTVGAGDSSLFGYLLGELRGRRPQGGSRWQWPTAARRRAPRDHEIPNQIRCAPARLGTPSTSPRKVTLHV